MVGVDVRPECFVDNGEGGCVNTTTIKCAWSIVCIHRRPNLKGPVEVGVLPGKTKEGPIVRR